MFVGSRPGGHEGGYPMLAIQFLVSLVKAIHVFPRFLDLLILDPKRSSSFFHWRPWIRTYKLTRAVRRENQQIKRSGSNCCSPPQECIRHSPSRERTRRGALPPISLLTLPLLTLLDSNFPGNPLWT